MIYQNPNNGLLGESANLPNIFFDRKDTVNDINPFQAIIRDST